ncbi:mucin-2-like [Cyprinus carpio]|uniref:Mucin-2-like n=1 Tax=Cyprinus carpio TaxID=7962 RepID=A0A9Q9YC87_CYPCA|nr:mucin-2-like [Cyprinus carpio]
MDGPVEVCKEDTVPLEENCGDENVCRDIFSSSVFSDCRGRVSIDSCVQVCMKDLCHCNSTSGSFCLCKSIAEYSRQCAHAGGKPEEWRSEYFCPHPCPESMVHQECGNPCTETCTNPEIGQVCEHHCIDGCFCPPALFLLIYTLLAVSRTVNAPVSLEVKYLPLGRITQAAAETAPVNRNSGTVSRRTAHIHAQ